MISRAQQDITLFVNPSALSTSIAAAPPSIKWVLDVMKISTVVMRAANSEDKRYDATYAAMSIMKIAPLGSQAYSIYNNYIKQ